MNSGVRSFVRIFVLVVLFFVSNLSVALAAGERIEAFHIQAKLQPNGSVLIQEEIVYDFGPDATNRHGIFRKVPLVFTLPGTKTSRTIEISSIMVTDGTGRTIHAEYSGGGNYMQLKIGEPDVLVTGLQRYVIKYTVWNAINQSFPNVDEFYWNATGNEWDVPIGSARVDIDLPMPIQESKLTMACFVGPAGSTERCSASTTPQEGTNVVNAIRYTYEGSLRVREGMTIAIGIPKGIYLIKEVSKVKTLAKSVGIYHWWRSPYLGVSAVIPIIVFLLMLRIWWMRGRDPSGRTAIIAEYEVPEHLSVLDLAYHSDNRITPAAISAAIVDLAVRGFISIERIVTKVLFLEQEDFRITINHDHDQTPLRSDAENILFEELRKHGNTFLLSSLTHQLVETSTQLSSGLAEDLIKRGYFENDPRKAPIPYILAAVACIALGMFLPYANFPLVTSGFVILIFAFLMPKRTKHGSEIHDDIEGFKDYLAVAEKDRIAFANAPAQDPKTFERFLPYAMVFGVEKEWAEKFKNLYTNDDSSHWYHGGNATLDAESLVTQMNSFSTSASAAFASSGSGGGGHSGGGGGGGSW